MLLVWSLLFGLALVGADLYVERETVVSPAAVGPSDSDGAVRAMEDGTPMPPR